MPIHVDNLLLTSNSKTTIQGVKTELVSHFKLHNQGLVKSILGMKLECNRVAWTIAISQPGYIKSILNQFGMTGCNPTQTLMEENQKLSMQMSPDDPEKQKEMKVYPY